MEKFIKDIKKYYKYAIYAAKSELKSEVANSHLSWLWWVLDPLLFMMVYTFISTIVFDRTEKYFPIFVFIGLAAWNFFDKCIKNSVKIVSQNSGIVTKVYIPKYILIVVKMLVNGFKMLVSFAIVFVMMMIWQVPLSPKLLLMFPLLILLVLLTFGFGTILMHFGVFIEDLANVMNVLLKFVFYLSGVFFAIDRIPSPYREILMKLNPMALIMNSLRETMLYDTMPDMVSLGIWFVIGCVLIVTGIKVIYKYENSYVKVI